MVRILKDTYATPDLLANFLDGEGHTGTLNDRMKAYLVAQGYTGSLSDGIANFVPSAGPSLSDFEVDGNAPEVIADFSQGFYAKTGVEQTGFSDVFSFARTGTATYFDSSGVLQEAATGVARENHHTFNGTSWVNKGLLLESEARTNMLERSEDFTAVYWTKLNSVVALDETGPDDTANSATTLTDNSATGTGLVGVRRDIVISTSTVYTFSCFAKADQLNFLALRLTKWTTPVDDTTAYFDLQNGTIASTDAGFDLGSTITAHGNGWYRCSVTFTTDGTDNQGRLWIHAASADESTSEDLDGTSSIQIFGAQFEEGYHASSYIPTDGATATRNAETLTISSADTSPSTTAISVHFKGEMDYGDENAGSQYIFWRWYNTAVNFIQTDMDTNSTFTGEINAVSMYSAVFDAVDHPTQYTAGREVPVNFASRHTSSSLNVAVDGVADTENSTPIALPNLDAVDLELGYQYNGTISLFRVWEDVSLNDTNLQTAST